MSQKAQIIQKLQELRPLLVERYALSYLGLFGSVVREEEGLESDIDILIEIDWEQNSLSGFDFFKIIDDLESSLGHHVDLVTRSNLHPILKPYILTKSVEIKSSKTF